MIGSTENCEIDEISVERCDGLPQLQSEDFSQERDEAW